MDELDKALDICLKGEGAVQALEAFKRQMKQWGVTMPTVEPLVLDLGLNDFKKTGLIECWIANETEAGYCGKYLFVFDGQTCPLHRHKEKIETFFIVKGSVIMTCGDKNFQMKPGDILRVDRWTYHSFTGKGPALLLELSTPCIIDDNYFENSNIPIGGNYKGKIEKEA